MKHSCSALVAFAFLLASGLAAEGGARFLARAWQSEEGLPSNAVRAVAQAADGYLWVGTAEGVVRFDGQRFTPLRSEPEAMLAGRAIRALFPLANGEVWVTTSGDELLRGRGVRLEEVPLPASAGSGPAGQVSEVSLGQDGEIAIVRGGEIWKFAGGKITQLTNETTISGKLPGGAAAERDQPGVRLRSARGELWEFTPGEGLTITDSAGRVQPVSLQTAPPSAVRAMMEDREGSIWLATGTQGLWRLRPARVEVLTRANGLSDRTARVVLEDRAGALWIAPRSGGLDYFSAGMAKHLEVGPEEARRPVSALLETRAGVLWAATRDSQVYFSKDGIFTPAFPKNRGADGTVAIAEDEQGRLWLGGRTGLHVWDGSDLRAIDLGAVENIMSLASAGSTVWVGMESGRLFRSNGGRFEAVASVDAFARQPISSLLPDADGGLWVGTLGGGLFHLRDGRVVACAPRMTDADPRITCVLDDGAGFLWLGTLGGICRVEKAKLLATSPATVSTVVLDRSDGLLTRECTRLGQPEGWRTRDGMLYFTTADGVARVHPDWLALNTLPPPVVIEEAGADGQSLAPAGERLQAGPGRSRLEFRYTALTFAAPGKVRFRTQLEGLDETWRDSGAQRTIAYEAVPPGRYRFRVMARNGDGVWNEAGAALAVEVLPHYWETRWFRAGAALVAAALAVGVGALVMRARMRGRLLRLEAQTSREKERARIAQDLHDDLGASLTEISLLANLAAEERGSNSREDDTLPEVAAKAQELVGALDEFVWAVNPRHDTLRSLAEYLAAFGGKFLSRAGMTLRRDIPHELPEVSLDAERRHSVFLAVREAINNAVKHSGASEVWLRIRLENQRLEIAVEDNGRGFDPGARSEGEGVGNLGSRLERLGGQCRIESRPGALTLSTGVVSTIDLGGGASIFLLANSSAQAWNGTLSITNWSGSTSGGGTDQLFFGTDATGLTAGQIAAVSFLNPDGFAPGTSGAQLLSTGELVVIPEPASAAMFLGGMASLLGLRRFRPRVV